jgi:hypothetical protein
MLKEDNPAILNDMRRMRKLFLLLVIQEEDPIGLMLTHPRSQS